MKVAQQQGDEMTLMTESQAWAYLAVRVATARRDDNDGHYFFFVDPSPAHKRKDYGLCHAVVTMRDYGMISAETCRPMQRLIFRDEQANGCRWPVAVISGVISMARFCTEMAELTKDNDKETR